MIIKKNSTQKINLKSFPTSVGDFDRARMKSALMSKHTIIPHGLTPQEIITFILTN